jgi:hypothetical protein
MVSPHKTGFYLYVKTLRIENAGHFSCIAPFPEALRQTVGPAAQDPAGVDRVALHQRLNTEIATFLAHTLP